MKKEVEREPDPTFLYTARDTKGRLTRGTLGAPNRDELVSTLQGRGFLVTAVIEEKKAEELPRRERGLRRWLRLDDLIVLARQLATLLRAGVTLLKSLDICSRQAESRSLYLALEAVKRDVESGYTLHSALAKHPRIFSDFWVGLTETGESSGQLPPVLEQLARYLELAGSFRRKIVTAMIYPTILVAVIIIALIIFTVRVIPTFQDIFSGFAVELPALTEAVFGFSSFVRRYIFILFAVLACLGYGFYQWVKTKAGRLRFEQLILKVPVFGRLFHQVALVRFTRGLSILVESGVPLLFALEIMGRSTGSRVMEGALEEVKVGVRDGKAIARPLERNRLFPPLVVQMVNVGEETGKLADMLGRAASFYEERVDAFVARLSATIEPMIIIFMGIVVGIIVASMFLPVFSIAKIGG